jgi:hypothetical protein
LTTLRSENAADAHRCFACPAYSTCLDESVREGWESFSCLQCGLATRFNVPVEDPRSFANQRRE